MAANADPHSFLDRYRCGELAEFFALAPGDTATALGLARPVDRVALASALRRQAVRLGAPPAALANLERLEHPDSRVVVTGQQTGLLLGPLFTLSKAFTAIRLAAALDSEERPVIPLFWMASQDHDHSEIDHAFLLDNDEVLRRVALDLPNDTPAGRMPLDDRAQELLRIQWAGAAFPEGHRAEVEALLLRSASGAASVADWFGALIYALLGERGLVLVDPLDRHVAVLFADVLRREITEPRPSVVAVRDAGERLRALGIDPQLGRGDGATNLFYERRESGGSLRVALKRDGGGFSAGGLRLSTDDLLSALADDPTLITPAAALRPVTQDRLLPTAVTVVGPGELRYFAQLRNVYRHHAVDMSLLWPRATATVVEPPVRRILAKYDLTVDAFVADPDGVRDRVLLDRHGHGDRFSSALASVEAEVATLIREVEAIDPTLVAAVERAQRHLETTVTRLRSKSASALLRQDGVTEAQFARLSAHLLPLGTPQERMISPFSLFLKFGIAPVIDLFATLPAEGQHVLEVV